MHESFIFKVFDMGGGGQFGSLFGVFLRGVLKRRMEVFFCLVILGPNGSNGSLAGLRDNFLDYFFVEKEVWDRAGPGIC